MSETHAGKDSTVGERHAAPREDDLARTADRDAPWCILGAMRKASARRLPSVLGALVVAAALGASACGANLAPVLNVNHVTVVGVPPGADATAYVHDAIRRAVTSRGWTVAGEAPGVVTATIAKEDVTATVDIPYTATDFSIVYRDSSPALKYDGTRIHKRYNHWVDRLRASITAELAKPTPPGAPPPPA
jgi:hypothetical protein